VAEPFRLSVRALERIQIGAALGSLIGVLGLVAVPVLLLGAVSQWAIQLSVDRVEERAARQGVSMRCRRLGR
jgi:hypothetical protein